MNRVRGGVKMLRCSRVAKRRVIYRGLGGWGWRRGTVEVCVLRGELMVRG